MKKLNYTAPELELAAIAIELNLAAKCVLSTP